MAQFARAMAGAYAPIRILQDDPALQVVTDTSLSATGYVIYKGGETHTCGEILSANAPCLIMTQVKEGGKKLDLALSDPDMHMDRTASNPFGYSLPTTLRLILKGSWKLDELVKVKSIKPSPVKLTPLPNGTSGTNGNTQLEVQVVDGLSTELHLSSLPSVSPQPHSIR